MEMPQPAFYILKCEQQNPPGMPKPSCVNTTNQGMFNVLSQKIMEKGIMSTVTPVRTSCLNRCQMGPVMLVEPGHFLYAGLTEDKIEKILDEHIIGGNPVEEYLIPSEFWGEAVSPKEAREMAGIS